MAKHHVNWISPEGNERVVSVLVAVYNGARYILDALDSVRANTYRPVEIVIVNDGSTDGSESLILWWIDRNSEHGLSCVYRSKQNGGLLSARNVGVRVSTGEYLQFLDQDDLLHPEKLSRCVDELIKSNSDVAIPRFEHFRNHSEGLTFLQTRPARKSWNLTWRERATASHYVRPYWGYLSPVFRRRTVVDAGPFPDKWRISAAEEVEFHLRVKVLDPKLVYIDKILALHRVTPGSITHSTNRTNRECSYAGLLLIWILMKNKILECVEWRYMAYKTLKRGWTSVRYTRDIGSFLVNGLVFVIAIVGWGLAKMRSRIGTTPGHAP